MIWNLLIKLHFITKLFIKLYKFYTYSKSKKTKFYRRLNKKFTIPLLCNTVTNSFCLTYNKTLLLQLLGQA